MLDAILAMIKAHPDQALNILDKFVDILKANPEILMAIVQRLPAPQ